MLGGYVVEQGERRVGFCGDGVYPHGIRREGDDVLF